MSDAKAAGTELSATGYTAGGNALTSVTFTESGHVYTLTAANPVWTALSGSPAFAIVYDSTPGTDATNPLICYYDFGGAISPGGGQFSLLIPVGGLVTITGS